MKVRVTYGIDKLLEGATYHEQHIIEDLKRLSGDTLQPPQIAITSSKIVGVDTEYSKDGELLTVGVASEACARGMEVTQWAAQLPNIIYHYQWITGHNIPGDVDQLLRKGLPVREEWLTGHKIIDSFVLSKMIDENKPKGSYGLEQLMLTEYNFQPWKEATDKKFKETGDARDWTPEEREERCRLDAWASYMLAQKYYPLVAHDDQTSLLVETIHRISMTLYRIGLAGAKVDQKYLEEFKVKTKVEMAQAEASVKGIAAQSGWDKPEPFQPTKDDDIRHLLFDILEFDPVGYTDGGLAAVDKTSLKQYDHEIIAPLLEYNRVQKLDSVYDDIDELIDEHGYLHFWINQLGARTGRRSSGGGIEGTPNSKNAQNWPPDAKKMIVSRFEGGMIGAFDYQSLEPIIASWISEDANLFDFFYNGKGYLDICKRVLGQDIDKTSKIYRAIKNMTLGVFYNMQAPKMAKNLWQILDFKFSEDWREHVDQTALTRKKILGLFPGWVRYMERQKIKLARDQQIVAPDGYVRHLPHHGESTPKYWSLVNQAINFPIQHLASMVTGCAMIDCEAAVLQEAGYSYTYWQGMLREGGAFRYPGIPILINEVHDELTWDFNPHTLYKYKELILETMASPPSLTNLIKGFTIRLKVDPKLNERW